MTIHYPWEAPPEFAEPLKVADGIFWFRVPLPKPSSAASDVYKRQLLGLANETLRETVEYLISKKEVSDRFGGAMPFLMGFARVLGGFYHLKACLLYTSPSPRDLSTSRMPSSA